MSDTTGLVQTELAKILKALGEEGFKALDFTKDQMPEVLEQAMMWGMWESSACIFVFISIATVLWWLVVSNCKDKEIDESSGTFFMGLIAFFSSIAVVFNALTVLKIIVAPKLWLLSYIKEVLL